VPLLLLTAFTMRRRDDQRTLLFPDGLEMCLTNRIKPRGIIFDFLNCAELVKLIKAAFRTTLRQFLDGVAQCRDLFGGRSL
jgi:hypothetical protein